MNQQQLEKVGRVFCYKPLLGFGFIYYRNPEVSGDESIFFHKNDSQSVQTLSPGDTVSFTVAADFKGRPCAKNVKRISSVDGDGRAK